MKRYNVGILGATGAVGKEMLKVLVERKFPLGEIRLFASARSAGKEMNVNGQIVRVRETDKDSFIGLDIVLGATEAEFSRKFAPFIKKAGAIFIDNSSAFRQEDNVPLVIPEINPEDIKKHNGIISNPNCSTIITLVAINAINKLSEIESVIASTYQAVSGAGAKGPIELDEQTKAIINKDEVKSEVFAHQIAQNLIPQIGDFNDDGYTSEEMKMQNEGRKILHLPNLTVTCTCVRVPVVRSHSISAVITTKKELNVLQVQEAIAKEAGCELYDNIKNNLYPMPLMTSEQDLVYVGRIRKDLTNKRAIALWCCGDQIRKGAATNAVQIAELVVKQ